MNYSTLLALHGMNNNAVPVLNLATMGLGFNPLANALAANLVKPGYEQTGPVYNGPGSLESKQSFMLLKLEVEQRELVERAKKFAVDENMRAVLARQAKQLDLQPTPIQKKAQTLTLLSRLYVGSISYELKEDSLRIAFQAFGPIRSITMSWDAATQKHKGFAFIEFEFPESAHLAVEQMNCISMGGRQLKVGRPSNLPQADALINELVTEYKLERKIYVSAVHPDLSEEDLSLVFEAFGKIISCELMPDPNKLQNHRGFGYIEYETEQSANDSVTSMNMFDLGGQFLRVCKAMTPPEDSSALLTPGSGMNSETHLNGRSPSGVRSFLASGDMSWDRIDAQDSNIQSSFNDEDDDGGSLESRENYQILDQDARSVMMQKSFRSVTFGVLILRNMVTPEECDDELEQEIKEECSNYGNIERVIIYQELDIDNVLIIKIFIVFTESESVDQAIDALNGRYFAGRQVSAERYDAEMFSLNDLTG